MPFFLLLHPRQRGRRFVLPAIALFGWLLLFPLNAPAAPDPSVSPPVDAPDAGAKGETSLAQIWSTRAKDVQALVEEAAQLQSTAEALAKPLAVQLQTARAQFARLSGLYQASRSHPTEQITLVQEMRALQKSVQEAIAPLEAIGSSISGRQQEIAALQKDMAAFTKESADEGVDLQHPGQRENAGLQMYNSALTAAVKALNPAVARLETLLAPARATLARIDRTVADIEKNMVSVWEDYYLTPSDNSLQSLASTPAVLADWASSLNARMGFAYPQSLDAWLYAARSFFSVVLIMGVIGFLVLQGAAALPERWRSACRSIVHNSWVFVGLGMATMVAANNEHGGIYFGFMLLGSLVIIAGVAALSWRLRVAVLPELETQPSPLGRLYLPAAIGVLMLFSDLPTRILGIVWGLIMVIYMVRFFVMNRRHKREASLPLLERLAYGCAFWFGLASFLVALAGYARLAILLFMALFALINIVSLGTAFMALLSLLVDRLFSKTSQPVHNAVAQAVSIPVAWCASLLCALPWIAAVPGALYLLRHVMSTNYTVGEASFDFSKLLIIALIFFFFRSFLSLGKSSLEHLPERVPNIERGVIPPLTTLLTYGLWALFGIIALAMLGVNFTSLAVVAGGLSVGIGFGMQNIFNNLVSGLMLIFGRTILVGDYVDVAGASGTVRAINIRSTIIETPDRALIYVPNSAIMANQFTNWTRNSRMVRSSLMIRVAYGSDTDLVSRLLLDAAKAQARILQFPPPTVFFSEFGASSLDFTLAVFIDDFDYSRSTMSDLRFTVERLFRERNIKIPFPQMTLHMPDAGPQATPAPAPAMQAAPPPDQARADQAKV